ncbi:hypothetical protein [Nocardioides sp. T2.26MG-1]|nr:hypothetical protein [Nocardioides sp. T2.26MG-1]CAI9411351.1 hypothetical protein HIDPHFAB_01520 [Nocardioides sp. T2.26MG-1]
MSARFDVEHAHLLRQSEAEWLRQSATRIRAARAAQGRDRGRRATPEKNR